MMGTGRKGQEGFTKDEVISISILRHVYSTSSIVVLTFWHLKHMQIMVAYG